MPLRAQTGGGTLAGNVMDQAGKPVEGADVTAKGESGPVSGTAPADAQGRFSVTDLRWDLLGRSNFAGFARNTRLGVPVGASVIAGF